MPRRGKIPKNYKPTAFDKASREFWALPSKNRPATTTTPSVRNLVHNVKSIPSAFKTVGSQIKTSLTKPAPKRGRGRRR